MKKIISLILLAALAVIAASCTGSAAGAPDYAAYLPENVEFVRAERDDGFTENVYRDQNGGVYELYIDNADTVRVLKYDSRNRSSASAAGITADEAFSEVTAVYPNAVLIHANEDRDDGAWEWDVVFSDDEILGEYELDASNGNLLGYTIFYGVPFGFEPEKIITASYPGAEIVDINLDVDDGRLQLDGKARLDSRIYEFSLDADSGKIIEWEWDD